MPRQTSSSLALAVVAVSVVALGLRDIDHVRVASAQGGGQVQEVPGRSEVSAATREFVTAAAQDGMAEVSLATLAQQRSTDPQVKAFADRMIKDHRNANETLRGIAGRQGIALPEGPGERLDTPLQRLLALQGKRFDQAYIETMVKDHEKAVSLFETYAANGGDAQVVDFAKTTLPVLKDHLKHARSLQGTLKAE